MFVWLREPDVLAAYVTDEAEKFALIASEPKVFFTLPHYDGHAMVLVRLDAIEVDELREVMTDAWRLRASKKLLAEFDATQS